MIIVTDVDIVRYQYLIIIAEIGRGPEGLIGNGL
jgi:hypothetical protein